MAQTFTNSFWKRAWVVDDEGIHEYRKGHRFATVRWHELKELDRSGAQSELGIRITPKLTRSERQKLSRYASELWKREYPDRWQIHHEQAVRSADRAVYFWMPLVILAPSLIGYILFWYLGSPEYLQPQIQKLHCITLVSFIYLSVLWIGYGYLSRKAKKREVLQNPAAKNLGDGA